MTTISKAGVSVDASMVLGWSSTRDARTVEHAIIGKPAPDFTLRASTPRGGTLSYFLPDLADAIALEALHGDDPAPVTLTDPAIPGGTLTYVVTGGVELLAADEAGLHWQVNVQYRATT